MTATAPTGTEARVSTLDRPTLMRLAAEEYDRFQAQLSGLSDADWTVSTDCPGWDVRAMASHVLGMAEMAASIRVGLRQQRAASKRAGSFIDALTAVQVDERRSMTGLQVRDRLGAVGPRAARSRRRVPGLVRRRALPMPQQVGANEESWTVGFLVDTILTRDVWMHRIDISRAVHRELPLDAEHDGFLVSDVVTEWLGRHGQPCQVHLTGPAGGSWTVGEGGPSVELDAIEFCRTVSGRELGAGLLTEQVPF